MQEKENRIIIDTNLWISFLISKNLSKLDHIIFQKNSRIIFSPELIAEFINVAQRTKFKRFFDKKDIEHLLSIFDSYGDLVKIHTKISICRDIKDNFLLALAIDSNADYLLTGDKDLLTLEKIGKTRILSINQFEKLK
jgi:uncharacterized protein